MTATAAAPRPGWQDRAACRPELLTPGDAQLFVTRATAQDTAQRFCADCPVIDSCRATAKAQRASGLWAGEWREERSRSQRPSRDGEDTATVTPLLNDERKHA